jgi:hypothetical protein
MLRRIVHQVGVFTRLYKDARSTKHKIQCPDCHEYKPSVNYNDNAFSYIYKAPRVCPFILIHLGVSDRWSGSISHAVMKPKVLESHNHRHNLAHTVLYVTQLPQSHDSCHQFASLMCDFPTCWTRSH